MQDKHVVARAEPEAISPRTGSLEKQGIASPLESAARKDIITTLRKPCE